MVTFAYAYNFTPFPHHHEFHEKSLTFLIAISDLAHKYQHILSPDENAPYDELIEINLSEVSGIK